MQFGRLKIVAISNTLEMELISAMAEPVKTKTIRHGHEVFPALKLMTVHFFLQKYLKPITKCPWKRA